MSKEPVAIWPTLGLVVGLFLQGIIPDMGDELITAIADLVTVGAPVLVGVWVARSKVTPVANPRDNEGNKLVPSQQ